MLVHLPQLIGSAIINLTTKPFTVQFFLIAQDANGRSCLLQIECRSQFKRLLKDIENDFYDAVVVMDYDRFSRDDKENRARVEKILQQSNALIVTPQRVYDLNGEDQEPFTDIKGVFARYEYRTNSKPPGSPPTT
jgi:DNA invertase Pin-like site-specific DNA recombinase